jgi:hypothetical protein
LFNKARDAFDEAIAAADPSEKLMNDMKETGLAMTKSAISTLEQMAVPMQVISAMQTCIYSFFPSSDSACLLNFRNNYPSLRRSLQQKN